MSSNGLLIEIVGAWNRGVSSNLKKAFSLPAPLFCISPSHPSRPLSFTPSSSTGAEKAFKIKHKTKSYARAIAEGAGARMGLEQAPVQPAAARDHVPFLPHLSIFRSRLRSGAAGCAARSWRPLAGSADKPPARPASRRHRVGLGVASQSLPGPALGPSPAARVSNAGTRPPVTFRLKSVSGVRLGAEIN